MPTESQPYTEEQAIECVRSLYELEQEPDHGRAIIMLGPFTAFTLIGALQLVLRHPDMSNQNKDLIRQVVDQMKPLFTGTLAGEIIKLGDNPEFDIPRGCQYPDGPHAPECPPGDHAGFTLIDVLPHDEGTSYCTSILGGCPVHPDPAR